ncbi:F-box protein At5g03100-like [Rutidosis leptorrhynchoides]|uniref:F-box protein At5g03100-like n=1 Tax=Rutidosis leptorrhynchoides TaxID=125765 RepID=UPI003A99374E
MEMIEKEAQILEEKDIISGLPDFILVEILTRLCDIKLAIRTGTLSKRWERIWTCVYNLNFSCLDSHGNPIENSKFISSIDKTLTQFRCLKINKFKLLTVYDASFVSQFNNWVHYILNCKVEQVDLTLVTQRNVQFPLPQLFFTYSCFRDLKVAGCVFNPTAAISWKQLKSLCISEGKLDEGLIENILCGSPLLETLKLEDCYGYRQVNISSKSVKNLVFNGFRVPRYDDDFEDDDDDVIEINAPYILSLKIESYLSFWKLRLLDVSSLVKAHLFYTTTFDGGHVTKREEVEEAEEEMLKGLILKLFHVKELQIGDYCLKALSRLEAKGFILPSNLKVDVTSPAYSVDDFLEKYLKLITRYYHIRYNNK